MRTFTFTQKNSGIAIILSAGNLEEAEIILEDTVKDNYGWRVEDEEGEEEG